VSGRVVGSIRVGLSALRSNLLRTGLSMLGVVIGVTFGTYPALRGARLSPIDAMRHE
jgi:ABC-type antimicrobial peptide transport system permease subunit